MNEIDNTTRRILADPEKRRAWVIYQVSIQGTSLAAIARDHGVSRQAVYSAFTKPYPRMEKLIADTVGLRPEQIFPERYTAEGLPARRMGRPAKKSVYKSTTGAGARNTQTAEVA